MSWHWSPSCTKKCLAKVLSGYISQFGALILDNELPGIFCLSETFLNEKVDDRLLYHEGFELERRDRIVKAGGGLLCYIQSDITYERRTDLENPTIETIWLEIKFSTLKNILLLLPPSEL